MDLAFSNISFEVIILFGISLIINIIVLILIASNKSKINKLKKKYNKFMNNVNGNINLEELLKLNLEKVNDISQKNKEIESRLDRIDINLLNCIQKVGVLRYNAFENMGSDLSFSIALLDKNDDGVVVSGIYSRDSSSTYAKPIVKGKSKYSLSSEEIQSIDLAKKEI